MTLQHFADWLTQSATIQRGTEDVDASTGESRSLYEVVASGVRCQYQVAQGAMARLSYGDHLQEFGTIFLDPGVDLRVGDKVLLDGDGVVHLVESIKLPRDQYGIDHLEAQVSRRPLL